MVYMRYTFLAAQLPTEFRHDGWTPERLLLLANDVGLLAEEYDTKRKRQAGNFPQAFSHISLVGAAYSMSHTGKGRHTAGDADD